MNTTRIELLQSMPIFGAVQTEVLTYLLRSSQSVAVKRGGYFFREGDLADSMFVLEQGVVAVHRNWQGTDFKLRELRAGDCFGEMALLDCQPRSASVLVLQDASAIEINTAQLAEIYEEFSDQFVLMQMNMAREVCRRLRAADRRLFELSMGDEHTEFV
jgi:CRP/FNR family cyclic AMP-dependent transcriptional regulator